MTALRPTSAAAPEVGGFVVAVEPGAAAAVWSARLTDANVRVLAVPDWQSAMDEMGHRPDGVDVVVLNPRQPGAMEFLREARFIDRATRRVLVGSAEGLGQIARIYQWGGCHALVPLREGDPESLAAAVAEKIVEAIPTTRLLRRQWEMEDFFPVLERFTSSSAMLQTIGSARAGLAAGHPVVLVGKCSSGRGLLAQHTVYEAGFRRPHVWRVSQSNCGLLPELVASLPVGKAPQDCFLLERLNTWDDDAWALVRPVLTNPQHRIAFRWFITTEDVSRLTGIEHTPVAVPSLNDRREDIGDLAHHYLDRERWRLRRGDVVLSPEAVEQLRAHPFELGGLGELRECMGYIAERVSGEDDPCVMQDLSEFL